MSYHVLSLRVASTTFGAKVMTQPCRHVLRSPVSFGVGGLRRDGFAIWELAFKLFAVATIPILVNFMSVNVVLSLGFLAAGTHKHLVIGRHGMFSRA
jgi:hypothetical protein